MTTTTPTTETQRNAPIHIVRVGMTQAAIWKHSNERGAYYKVTFERRYRDNDAWNSTASFGPDDLLRVAKAADIAETWIRERKASDAAANPTPKTAA